MGDFTKRVISCCRNGANLINGYEAALIGVSDNMLPIYDYWRLVRIARERGNITASEAIAYVDANIIRHLPADKENGPIIIYGIYKNNNSDGK